MTKARFEDIIAERGELIYTNVGDSMYPLIQPRDLLVIKKAELPLKRLDIPLYKRDNGQYVLHRIIRVCDGGYWLCGDNRTSVEKGITDRHIIGVLTAIIRDGATVPVKELDKQHHARLHSDLLPVKKKILRIKRKWKKK